MVLAAFRSTATRNVMTAKLITDDLWQAIGVKALVGSERLQLPNLLAKDAHPTHSR